MSVLGKKNATTAFGSSGRVIPLQQFSEVCNQENVDFCANAQDLNRACERLGGTDITGWAIDEGKVLLRLPWGLCLTKFHFTFTK